jgi:uncharacterized protein (TIGR03382 family)
MRWAIALLISTGVAHATDYTINPGDNLYTRLQSLVAGDTLTVHAGTYMTPGFLEVHLPGTANAPILVQAATGEHVVMLGTPAQNVMNLSGSYFTLDGFEIAGGSHGLRLHSVDHATLSNLVLHDLGDVGISCNFEPETCDVLTIYHNEIYDTGHSGTGEGMYLGCNDDLCRMTNSTVANNYLHDIGGSQGDGIEIKTGSYNNVVEDNVIVRANYPGITMYGYTGTQPRNQVLRNLVWHTKADNGIQIVGQILVENNLVIDSAANGIQSKPSQNMTPHDAVVRNNTVVGAAGGACMKTNNWSTEAGDVVVNNALYCSGGTAIDLNGGVAADAVVDRNIGLGASTAATGFTAGTGATDFHDIAADWYPSQGSPLVNAGRTNTASVDFNNTPRTDGMPDVGGYEVTTATNPGWIPTEGFKVIAVGGDGPLNAADDFFGMDPGGTPGGGCCDATSDPTSAGSLAAFMLLVLRRRRR